MIGMNDENLRGGSVAWCSSGQKAGGKQDDEQYPQPAFCDGRPIISHFLYIYNCLQNFKVYDMSSWT